MQSKSDAQLLREYADGGVEAAFAEIVHRHTNLVYSAALRLGNSPDTAPEIAQNVFIGLARGAQTLSAQLTAEASLAGWLCRSTRNQALKLWRDDSRRHSRERMAMDLLNPISETAPDWESLSPVLDEAMAELPEPDYDALVLRFFNNQDLRAVGRALGVSDDTAQKRVARALDKLRENLTRRGVATTGAALSIVISANAVQAAPVGLAITISAAAAALAGTAIAATATATATKAIVMTTLQKALIATTLVAGVATPLVIQHQAKLREENQSLRQQIAQLKTDNEGLSRQVAPAPRLPAPSVAASGVTIPSAVASPYDQMTAFIDLHHELPREQIEAYLQQNHRTVESLLAAFRASRDPYYLREAATNSPNDPAVQFAVIASNVFPEEKRKWIDAFKASSPDNALAWYFSALDYFKSKQTDQAIQELTSATRRQLYGDYAAQTSQAVEEMYDLAGWPALAAKAWAPGTAPLSYLTVLKDLANETVQTEQHYFSQGDAGSAIAMASMGMGLGDQLRRAYAPIDQLVGIAIEKQILTQLNPAGNYDFLGRPVSEALAELDRQRESVRELLQTRDQLLPTLNESELVNYCERQKLYGEVYALHWLRSKHRQP